MNIPSRCEIASRGYGIRCTQDAVGFVTYFQDGSGGKSACGKHISKAIEEVLSSPTVGSGAHAEVWPMGRLRKRIDRRG